MKVSRRLIKLGCCLCKNDGRIQEMLNDLQSLYLSNPKLNLLPNQSSQFFSQCCIAGCTKKLSKFCVFFLKELRFCHKLNFLIIYVTKYRRPLIFQTINYVRWDSLSLKYQRFTSTGCEDIRIRKFEFVTNTHFLSQNLLFKLLRMKCAYAW